MKEKITKLIDVKTIITLSIIWAVIGLAYMGSISADSIKDMALMVVGYFFGVKKAVSI